MISLTPIDCVIVLLFILFFIVWGLKNGKSSDSQSYFLAARSSSWWIIGFSLFTASISSTTLIGQSGDAYHTGISVYNYNLTGVIVMSLFAVFLLPLYIKSKIFTIPEFLEKRFDKRSRFFFSAICIIGNIFLDAAGALYAGALIIKLIYPESDIQIVVIIFAIIAASYTIPGGLSSVIKTELVQALILIAGTLILTYFCFQQGGDYLLNLSNSGHELLKLIRPLDDSSTPWLGVILGMPIIGIYFWSNNQTMVQRMLSAKNVDEGRKGLILTGFLTMAIMLLITISGVMAKYLFPELGNPDLVYPTMIVKLLPKGFFAIMLVTLLAALLSAISSILNATSTLFTMDFFTSINKNTTSKQLVLVGKITSIVVIIIASLWAPQIGKFGSLLKYYQEMLSYLAPPVVAVFLLGIFNKRVNGNGAFVGLIVGTVIAICLLLFKPYLLGNIHFLLVVPFVFAISLLVIYTTSLFTPAPLANKIIDLMFTSTSFRNDISDLKNAYYKSYLFWTIILLLFTLAIWILFG